MIDCWHFGNPRKSVIWRSPSESEWRKRKVTQVIVINNSPRNFCWINAQWRIKCCLVSVRLWATCRPSLWIFPTAPRGRFHYHHFTNEERLREFNQVTQSQNLESNLGVSDFSAGVLTLMLHREMDRKYGLFLLGHVSSFKDKNQITYLDLGGSSRSMISAPWNILYSDSIGTDLGVYVAPYPFLTAQKFQVWHVSGQINRQTESVSVKTGRDLC